MFGTKLSVTYAARYLKCWKIARPMKRELLVKKIHQSLHLVKLKSFQRERHRYKQQRDKSEIIHLGEILYQYVY